MPQTAQQGQAMLVRLEVDRYRWEKRAVKPVVNLCQPSSVESSALLLEQQLLPRSPHLLAAQSVEWARETMRTGCFAMPLCPTKLPRHEAPRPRSHLQTTHIAGSDNSQATPPNSQKQSVTSLASETQSRDFGVS